MLRADLLPENEKQQAKELIEEYVQIRMEAVTETDEVNLHSVLERSTEIQLKLWESAVAFRKESGDPAINLYLASLNQLIDVDAERRTKAFLTRFPAVLWLILFSLITLVTVTIGINSGLHGRRSRMASTALIVVFSLVIVLIVDLERPHRSLLPAAGSGISNGQP